MNTSNPTLTQRDLNSLNRINFLDKKQTIERTTLIYYQFHSNTLKNLWRWISLEV